MFLSGALFVLFLAGCWLYCLADAALTPAAEFPGLRKRTWLAVISVTFILGATAWYITRSRRRRHRRWPRTSVRHVTLAGHDGIDPGWYPGRPLTAAEAAFARHPASQAWRAAGLDRAVPIGPDDDLEFLRQLSERIRREQ